MAILSLSSWRWRMKIIRAALPASIAARFDGQPSQRSVFIVWGLLLVLGLFLLFAIQIIAARLLLPHYGGGGGVWTMCMVFLQLSFLFGYIYAHLMLRSVPIAWHAVIQIGLLLVSLLILPIEFDPLRFDVDPANPNRSLLLSLLVELGLPCFLLAAQAALIQIWLIDFVPAMILHRFYVLVLLGAILLLSFYPSLIEVSVGLDQQLHLWSILYGFVIVGMVLAIMWIRRIIVRVPESAGPAGDTPVTMATGLLWLWQIGLSAAAMMMVLAITEELTRDVVPFAFLWILPLSIYVLSFTLCFSARAFYSRAVFWPALVPVLLLLWFTRTEQIYVLNQYTPGDFLFSALWSGRAYITEIAIWNLVLFVFCMIAHGEIMRTRPLQGLNGFYLTFSVGGALGAMLAAFAAPLIFAENHELLLSLIIIGLLSGLRCIVEIIPEEGSIHSVGTLMQCATVGILGAFLLGGGYLLAPRDDQTAIACKRDFYARFCVRDEGGDPSESIFRALYYGLISHDAQAINPSLSTAPTTYFTAESGIGTIIKAMNERYQTMKVGILGLGIGTLAAYGRPGDLYRFYETNPDIVTAAQTYFSYLDDSSAMVDIVLEDGRDALSRHRLPQYDMLIINTVSGDTIPAHLLTREAMSLYLSRLRPDGILAINISSRYLDLGPVIQAHAYSFDLAVKFVEYLTYWERDDEVRRLRKSSSLWAIMAGDGTMIATLQSLPIEAVGVIDRRDIWTDDHTSILHLLR